jgi:2-C-methyl-D-erythritol 2,4-cyclodiphosphate synthase
VSTAKTRTGESQLKTVEEFIVPWVRQSEPYSARHMDFASENPHLIRMMSNENLLPPSQKVLDAIIAVARTGNLYPDSGARLRQMLGERAGLSAEHVVLGNGSTDIINTVVHTFVAPGDEAVISVPTFPMYEARVRIAGGKTVLAPMTRDFYWDMDAILGALGKGDIGRHFPDTDPAYRGADSLLLLRQVVTWMSQEGFEVNNVDTTLVAERPRISPHVSAMKERLSAILGIPSDRISIKATTCEGMGFCGREEGMVAYAVVSLEGK